MAYVVYVTFILFPPEVFTLSEDNIMTQRIAVFPADRHSLYEEHGYSAAINASSADTRSTAHTKSKHIDIESSHNQYCARKLHPGQRFPE